jgi:hypothetical protein
MKFYDGSITGNWGIEHGRRLKGMDYWDLSVWLEGLHVECIGIEVKATIRIHITLLLNRQALYVPLP